MTETEYHQSASKGEYPARGCTLGHPVFELIEGRKIGLGQSLEEMKAEAENLLQKINVLCSMIHSGKILVLDLPCPAEDKGKPYACNQEIYCTPDNAENAGLLKAAIEHGRKEYINHVLVGRLLGYCDDDINAFLHGIGCEYEDAKEMYRKTELLGVHKN